MTQDITVIIGPTAIGKSALAVTLAEESRAEIISADAFQIYKGMDIGTAKVSEDIRQRVPHHLIDIQTPDQPYSVAKFLEMAEDIITRLRQKNTPIIICGGTAFYSHAFLYNYHFSDNNAEIQTHIKALEEEVDIRGNEALWEELRSVDPPSAEATPYQNTRRMLRRLAIYRATGKPASLQRPRTETPRADCTSIGLRMSRELLYEKINNRVELMISQGLIEEVEALLKDYPPNCPGFQALGYKECVAYLNGRIEKEEMIGLVKQKTRHFAKRQLTWYRKFKNVNWTECY